MSLLFQGQQFGCCVDMGCFVYISVYSVQEHPPSFSLIIFVCKNIIVIYVHHGQFSMNGPTWMCPTLESGPYHIDAETNERHFADAIFKCIFLNENVWIWIKISLKFVPKGPINNIPAMVQIMAWRRLGDKPLSEPMMVSLPTHIGITQPQWVRGAHFHCIDWWQYWNRAIIELCIARVLFKSQHQAFICTSVDLFNAVEIYPRPY